MTTRLKTFPKTQLVIVTEAVLEKPLLREARERGAHAWTVCDVRGAWLEGERSGDWEAERSIEIKIICDADVAEALAEHVLHAYARHYSVAISISTVAVLRPERF
jgi:phosphoribosyl-AMP cyclohydrolase